MNVNIFSIKVLTGTLFLGLQLETQLPFDKLGHLSHVKVMLEYSTPFISQLCPTLRIDLQPPTLQSSALPTELILLQLNEWGNNAFLSFYSNMHRSGKRSYSHVSTILQHQRFIKFFLLKASSCVAGLK